MAVKVVESREPFGVVKTRGINITGFNEKPINKMYINAGIYLIESKILKNIKKFLLKNEKMDMPDLYRLLIDKQQSALIYPFFDYWADIGNKSDYLKLRNRKTINN